MIWFIIIMLFLFMAVVMVYVVDSAEMRADNEEMSRLLHRLTMFDPPRIQLPNDYYNGTVVDYQTGIYINKLTRESNDNWKDEMRADLRFYMNNDDIIERFIDRIEDIKNGE